MLEDYRNAKKKGDKAYRHAVTRGNYPYLPALDDALSDKGPLSEELVGTFEIPLALVAGTKTRGRQNAFASNFMPILSESSEFARKWSDLYDSQIQEGIREPIKAFEYMRRFYVQEGNKRVSVSKAVDALMIQAEVTRILPPKSQVPVVKVYYEFLDFYKVAPTYELEFTQPGYYKEFAERIGMNLTDPWPVEVFRNVRSAIYRFDEIFRSLGGDELSITSSDALLIYMHLYNLYSVLTIDKAILTRRLQRLWNEFLTLSNDQRVELVASPEEAAKGAEKPRRLPFLDVLKKEPKYTEDNPLRIAFVYDSAAEDSSWTYLHELGRNELENAFPGLVVTEKYESCRDETAFRQAMEKAQLHKVDMVFTITPNLMEMTLRAAIHFPDIHFLNCSVNLPKNAVRTYYARMYEAKFLMGALAASMAPNHKIGYRADYPIFVNIANINAFAIGAAMVDPECKIILKWSTQDKDWKKHFLEEGVSIISGIDMINPHKASRAYGVYRITENGDVENLAAPVWNWGKYYSLIVGSMLDGTWYAKPLVQKGRAFNYWYGMSSGVVDVILSDHLPYYSRKLVKTLKNAVMAETLNPFEGELHSQKGLIQGADAPTLAFDDIINMAWLNDNIEGSLPDFDSLNEKARRIIQVSGVDDSQTPEVELKDSRTPEAESEDEQPLAQELKGDQLSEPEPAGSDQKREAGEGER